MGYSLLAYGTGVDGRPYLCPTMRSRPYNGPTVITYGNVPSLPLLLLVKYSLLMVFFLVVMAAFMVKSN